MELDWWFKLAMGILIPVAAILLVANIIPLPHRRRKND